MAKIKDGIPIKKKRLKYMEINEAKSDNGK